MILAYGEFIDSENDKLYPYKLKTELLFQYKDGRSEKHTFHLEPYGHEIISAPAKEKPLKIILDPDLKLLFKGEISEKKSR